MLLKPVFDRRRDVQQENPSTCPCKIFVEYTDRKFCLRDCFLPIHILVVFKGKPTRGLEIVHLALAYFLRLASVCGCTMIAFDRFMYVCYPFRYLIYLVDTK